MIERGTSIPESAFIGRIRRLPSLLQPLLAFVFRASLRQLCRFADTPMSGDALNHYEQITGAAER